MNDGDRRIREIAYFIWEEEGRPEGQADRHWLTAQSIVDLPVQALPEIAKKVDDLVDDAVAVSEGLWITYLGFLFYLAIAAGAVTHTDLFFEKPVKIRREPKYPGSQPSAPRKLADRIGAPAELEAQRYLTTLSERT